MPTNFTVLSASRAGDDVTVIGRTLNGKELQVHLWWSHLQPLTPAQRLAEVGKALAAALPPSDVDLGISGSTVSG